MTREIQLDIFEEAKKLDSVDAKIKRENESYEKRKLEISREMTSTEAALKGQELSWQDRNEYEQDIRQYKRDLESLERTHQKVIADLSSEREI